jgi:alpha-galactosidase
VTGRVRPDAQRPVIAFIGAGSTVFTRSLVGDVLSVPELASAELRLFDIDGDRLAVSEATVRALAGQLDAHPTIVATTDRPRALDGADFAFNTIQVAGFRPGTVVDFEIPRRYGLRQTIGDTLGIGGIMRALRTIPVILDMLGDMERWCPDVLHLNYVNPMSMIVMAANRASPVRTVGLCHSVQGTAHELARDVGVPPDEVSYLAAGINHLAFYLRFEHEGRDLYPDLMRIAAEGREPETNRVRYEVLRRLGYFVTESSEHFAEYVPWFIKRGRPDLIERFGIPLDEYLGRCEASEIVWPFVRAELTAPGSQDRSEVERALAAASYPLMEPSRAWTVAQFDRLHRFERSSEYGATIIESVVTGRPSVIYGNVPNAGLIDALPNAACVEVPCLVDENGVQPTRVAGLPPQLTPLMRSHVGVHELVVEALLRGRREHVYHAAMMDPHTAAELSLDEIVAMVDELIEAHGAWIPESLRGGRVRATA